MDYHVVCNGGILVSCEAESDRDVCLMAMEEAYPDYDFEKKNDA